MWKSRFGQDGKRDLKEIDALLLLQADLKEIGASNGSSPRKIARICIRKCQSSFAAFDQEIGWLLDLVVAVPR